MNDLNALTDEDRAEGFWCYTYGLAFKRGWSIEDCISASDAALVEWRKRWDKVRKSDDYPVLK